MNDWDAETLEAKAAATARLQWRAALRRQLPRVETAGPAQAPLFVLPGDLETRNNTKPHSKVRAA